MADKKEELREAILDNLIDRIKNGEEVVTKAGEVVTVKVGAPILSVGLAYLKNHSEVEDDSPKVGELSSTLQHYGAKMPFRAVK